jgi:nucleoside-diphosphate-sugar epimerase
MKAVVVTGGSGFIGREALRPLLDRGFEVHLFGRPDSGRQPMGDAGLRLHACDLIADSPRDLLRAIHPTHLLHLAWYVAPGLFWSAPENLDWVAASIRLVREFVAAGGRQVRLRGCQVGAVSVAGNLCWRCGTVLRMGAHILSVWAR